jgi:hypothetical protein
MKKTLTICAMLAVAAGCASAKREPFDPASDPRVGAEVERACFSSPMRSSGGYVNVGGRDAYVTGTLSQKYLLLFSPGCGDIDGMGSFPVFYEYGDSCRRRGERVETARAEFGVTGACVIQKIYEWNPDAEEPEEDETDA